MGFRFRKSFGFGPFRATISKSGISTSVGVKGARITKRADGKTQTTVSIPGTGISHVSTTGGKQAESKQAAPTGAREEQSRDYYDMGTKKQGCGCAVALGVAFLILVIALFSACEADQPESEPIEPPAVEAPAKAPPASSRSDAVEESPEPEPDFVPESDINPQPASPEASDPEPEPESKPEPAPEPELVPAPIPAPAPAPAPKPEPEPPAAVEPVTQGVIGNKNSKKFHELSCSSIGDIKDSNKVQIESAEAAIAKGYEPCQRCH